MFGNWYDITIGKFGTAKVSDTALHQLDFDAFHVPAGATVAELYIDGEDPILANNKIAEYDLSGNGFEANDFVTARGDSHFSAIKLGSGAVNCVRKKP